MKAFAWLGGVVGAVMYVVLIMVLEGEFATASVVPIIENNTATIQVLKKQSEDNAKSLNSIQTKLVLSSLLQMQDRICKTHDQETRQVLRGQLSDLVEEYKRLNGGRDPFIVACE